MGGVPRNEGEVEQSGSGGVRVGAAWGRASLPKVCQGMDGLAVPSWRHPQTVQRARAEHVKRGREVPSERPPPDTTAPSRNTQ